LLIVLKEYLYNTSINIKVVIPMSERKKQVKVIRNPKSQQCLVSIPKSFWDLIPKSGFFEMTEQNGCLLLTPTQKKQSTASITMPVFECDSNVPTTSSHEVTKKEENQVTEKKELLNIKPDPSINLEEVPDLLADDDSEVSSKHPDWEEN
jgi:hypothetical protein